MSGRCPRYSVVLVAVLLAGCSSSDSGGQTDDATTGAPGWDVLEGLDVGFASTADSGGTKDDTAATEDTEPADPGPDVAPEVSDDDDDVHEAEAPDDVSAADNGDAESDGSEPVEDTESPDEGCTAHADCDDGIACTTDVCTIEGDCTHALGSAVCLIDGECVAQDVLSPANECLHCDPGVASDQWSSRPEAPCDDGDPCTLESFCNKDACEGVAPESCCGDGVTEGQETCDGDCPETCDDGDPCTVDTLAGAPDDCDVTCTSEPLASCVSGDTCCPDGCTWDEDTDCEPPPDDPPPEECIPNDAGFWVGDVFWSADDVTDPDACLGVYYQHADALTACDGLGEGWTLPSEAQADALLAAMDNATEKTWFLLVGNGFTNCTQTQQGVNGVWWLSDHNGASGGAAIMCNSGSCWTTGTNMGDSYYYRVRCVREGCPAEDPPEGCPQPCEEPPVDPPPDDPPPDDAPPTALIWTDNTTNLVRQVPIGGGVPETLAEEPSFAMGVTVDPTTHTLYWTAYTAQAIRYRELPDGPIQSFTTPSTNPAALDFDPGAGKLYWTEATGGVRRSDPDGSNVETLVAGVSFALGMELDLANGHVYWSEESANVIRRVGLNGGEPEVVVSSELDKPRGIALHAGYVYWADRGSQTVRRQPVDGGGMEVIANGFLFVQDVAIAADTETAYIVDDGIAASGTIYATPITGGGMTVLVPNLGTPKHLVLWAP